MVPELETLRLLLKPLRLEDATQTQSLFGQWEVVKDLAAYVPWPYPPDGSHTYYRDVAIPAMERGEQWHWTLRLKTEPDRIVGQIGLQLGATNRGFWMDPAYQGRGLMSEAVEVVTDYWFGPLGQPVLRTMKAVGNVASSRISRKTGMRLVRIEEQDLVSGPLSAEIWEVTAEEWLDWRKRTS